MQREQGARWLSNAGGGQAGDVRTGKKVETEVWRSDGDYENVVGLPGSTKGPLRFMVLNLQQEQPDSLGISPSCAPRCDCR